MNLPRVSRAGAVIALALSAILTSGCGTSRFGWVPGVSGGSSPDPVRVPEDPEAEIARLEAKAAADPAEPYWPFRIGEIRRAQARDAEAEAALRQALERDPDHAPSLSLLSDVLYRTGRHDEAIDRLESARARTRLPEVLDVALALHYDAVDSPDVAEQIVESLGDDVDWSGAGSAVAYVRLRGTGFAQSLDVARRALDAADSAVNHNNYGIALLYEGHPDEAAEHFRQAADRDPALPGPLYNLAIVERFYRFDESAARDWFHRYRQLSDEDPDGLGDLLSAELAREGTP